MKVWDRAGRVALCNQHMSSGCDHGLLLKNQYWMEHHDNLTSKYKDITITLDVVSSSSFCHRELLPPARKEIDFYAIRRWVRYHALNLRVPSQSSTSSLIDVVVILIYVWIMLLGFFSCDLRQKYCDHLLAAGLLSHAWWRLWMQKFDELLCLNWARLMHLPRCRHVDHMCMSVVYVKQNGWLQADVCLTICRRRRLPMNLASNSHNIWMMFDLRIVLAICIYIRHWIISACSM